MDLLIGAVLVPGARAPKLITREMLKQMRPGSVLVDIAIDQGGCAETSRPTTHHDPVYVEEGVTHYCVANMPGAYARTATQALTNVTDRYVELLADQGLAEALARQPALLGGINVYDGKVTCRRRSPRRTGWNITIPRRCWWADEASAQTAETRPAARGRFTTTSTWCCSIRRWLNILRCGAKPAA